MLGEINKAFNSAKNNEKERQFMLESVLDDDELIGDGDDDMEDIVDADSIPDDVYKRVDAALDKMIGDGIDDTEVEEMVDDDMSDINTENIDLVITEAVGQADKKFWYDDENIGHPDQSRDDGVKQQPIFDPSKKLNENTLAGKQYKSVVDEAVEKVATAMGNAISEAVTAGMAAAKQLNEAEAKETKISEKEASPDGHEIKEEPSGSKGEDKVEIGDDGEKATDVPEGEVTLGHCAESKAEMKVLDDKEMGPADNGTDKKVEDSGKDLPDPIDEKEKGSDADVKDATVDNSGKELENKEMGPNTCTDDDKKPKAENQTPEVEVAPENKDAATQLKESAEETPAAEEEEVIDEANMTVLFKFGNKIMSNQDPLFENAVDLELSYGEALCEGYNFDQADEVNATIKEAKARLKTAKKQAKSGDVAGAKESLDALIKDLEKYKKQFKAAQNADQTVMNAVWGLFARGLQDIGLMLITMLPTFGLSAVVIEIKEIIDMAMMVINGIGKLTKGEEITPADFNMYTKSLEDAISRMIQKVKKVRSDLGSKKLGSDEPVQEVAAESVEGVDIDFEAELEEAALKYIEENFDVETLEPKELDETVLVGEGAAEARKVLNGENMKAAKALLKEANKLAKAKNYDEAEKKYDEAIAALKKVKDEAKEIKNDSAAVYLATTLINWVAGTIAITFTCMVPGIGAAARIAGAIIWAVTTGHNFQIGGSQDKTNANPEADEGHEDDAGIGHSRGEALRAIDRMIATAEKLKGKMFDKKAKEEAKEEKKAEAQNESVEEMDEDESLPGINDELYENVAVISNYRNAETIEASADPEPSAEEPKAE